MIKLFDILFLKIYSPFVAIFGLYFGVHHGLAYALPCFVDVPLEGWFHLLIAIVLILAGVMFTIITITKFWR
tara:strand:+ start:360 stop:575 length:216 start_codon:yes stop_codon:yes gene_type:complete